MATRPDKKQIIDEVWDDARVKSFLQKEGPDPSLSGDFFVLWKAYQSMRENDFRRFLRFFVQEGRDLDASNEHGQTLAEMILSHRHAGPFIDALIAAGATPPTKQS